MIINIPTTLIIRFITINLYHIIYVYPGPWVNLIFLMDVNQLQNIILIFHNSTYKYT